MHTDVDRRMGGVGQTGALVEAERGIAVAQKQGRQAASLEFLAQAAGEGESDIFFRQLVGEGCAAFVASVAGIDNGKITTNGGGGAATEVAWCSDTPAIGGGGGTGADGLGWCGRLRNRLDNDGASVVGEARHQRRRWRQPPVRRLRCFPGSWRRE